MKLIYVAGPFNGNIGDNVATAERVACDLVKRFPRFVYPVVPHSLGRTLYGVQSEEDAYAGTLELLRRCDAVFMVGDWMSSKGATAEKAEAERLGKPVFGYDKALLGFGKLASWLGAK